MSFIRRAVKNLRPLIASGSGECGGARIPPQVIATRSKAGRPTETQLARARLLACLGCEYCGESVTDPPDNNGLTPADVDPCELLIVNGRTARLCEYHRLRRSRNAHPDGRCPWHTLEISNVNARAT